MPHAPVNATNIARRDATIPITRNLAYRTFRYEAWTCIGPSGLWYARRAKENSLTRLGHGNAGKAIYNCRWALGRNDEDARHEDGCLLRIYVLTKIPPLSGNTTIIECVMTVTKFLAQIPWLPLIIYLRLRTYEPLVDRSSVLAMMFTRSQQRCLATIHVHWSGDSSFLTEYLVPAFWRPVSAERPVSPRSVIVRCFAFRFFPIKSSWTIQKHQTFARW